ncbi:uncharacterized protein LOC124155545 isoform X2 [Ischnura elegans]|uniref:uncharacterized protein LOC124155545 isoform X2 n=1 Tax=Ischnura elegans TaxID=197161 RepID=UPI001ED896AD|nr:uncharacterized protein LOC124155545 isoform X2 [Ischnura elegans]
MEHHFNNNQDDSEMFKKPTSESDSIFLSYFYEKEVKALQNKTMELELSIEESWSYFNSVLHEYSFSCQEKNKLTNDILQARKRVQDTQNILFRRKEYVYANSMAHPFALDLQTSQHSSVKNVTKPVPPNFIDGVIKLQQIIQETRDTIRNKGRKLFAYKENIIQLQKEIIDLRREIIEKEKIINKLCHKFLSLYEKKENEVSDAILAQ